MNPELIELLEFDFGGHQFEELADNFFSMCDDENTIVLKEVNDNWQVWIDGSLCVDSDLTECINWIKEAC